MENNCSSLLKSVNLVRGPERVRDPAVPPAVPGSALRGADDEGFGGEGAAWEAAEEGGCHRGGGCRKTTIKASFIRQPSLFYVELLGCLSE